MENVTTKQINALLAVANGIIDSIREGDPQRQGVSGGTLYAALMTTGMTLSQFEQIMDLLVRAGKLVKTGQLYRLAEGK